MLYTSVNNPKIKDLAKLKIKKYRDKYHLFLVEGTHLVKEAYQSGYLKELLILENSNFHLDIETNCINETVLNYLTSVETPSGIIGICKYKEMSLKGDKMLILDSIQDPGNLGTIIRSSVAFDIVTIIINDKCPDPYSDKVIRSSQGMIFKINIVKKDLKQFINSIKRQMPIYGTKVTGGKNLNTIEKKSKFAIIMGNEGNGVSQDLLDLCDEYIYIPMHNNCESLNVGVATSIILYEFTK